MQMSDMILGTLIYDFNLSEVAQSSLSFVDNKFSILGAFKPQQKNIWSLFDVFTAENWLFLLFFYLFLSMASAKNRSLASLFLSFSDQFRAALKQGLDSVAVARYHRLCLASWLLISFAYSFLFANEMLANLTAAPKRSVDTVKQLIEDDTIKAIAFKELYITKFYVKVND